MKKKSDRNAFNFMKSYYEAIKKVSKKNQPKLLEAIVKYSFEDDYEPHFNGELDLAWTLIKPILNKSFTNYQNAKSNKDDG